ncbi:MAG: protein-export chaperone SecB [Rhodospirillaceae bacterium]|jgi:preprotein translocase subunit SecB|nr:protein-export chaperone SecB [Rhodospirillaceae bacterium]MBT5242990.1 protein-export chaperone SecB [Rhodospirillaceae bacterium]MBT5563215.1 protein-export chaperone SecB [Rhodospirillaceae bacterium]MBT6243529.1 protein-export chaperone SecB [Rhodospirillaceae bacterium]MBT7138016.1 protein-export chaperone SecB [Rhodospirillaceae bacterium]
MSDQTEQPTDGQDAPAAPPIQINAQYIKDLSFEAPSTPGIFGKLQKDAPDVTINVDVNAHPVQDSFFEVQLHIRATCKVGEETAFISELVYGGLFTINVPEEHLQAILLIECPRLLFPFARNIVADCSRDGGFPPLMLAPVDFVAMFQNQVSEKAGADNQTSQSPDKGNNKDQG